MKNLLAITAAVALSATASVAQVTTQSSIAGPSGDSAYPLSVQGANGVEYACKDSTEVRDGVVVRACRSKTGGLAAQGNAVAIGGAALAGVVFLALVLDDDSSSTTTTGSP
ncbi:MAG: hypothetical protein ACSHXB_05995 [Sulfitobacter sp.]